METLDCSKEYEMIMLTIRPAQIEEIPALWKLRNRAAWAGCATSYSHEQLSLWLAGPLPDRFAELVAGGTAFVAQEGDALLGYGALNVCAHEVEAVFVDPTASGRGLGGSLLRQLEATAQARALSHLELSSSLNAVSFYAAAGYKEMRRENYELANGVLLASVIMRKALTTRINAEHCLTIVVRP
jgi:putative acetyltransferase